MKVLWRTVIPLATAVAFTGLFVSLGQWQMNRAAEKESLYADFDQGIERAAAELGRYQPQPRYSRVRLSGQYQDQGLLLDNQQLDGQVGAHVISLFQPAAGGPVLLVNRGWTPLARDRRTLPSVPPEPSGTVELEGVLTNLPRPGFQLGEVDYGSGEYPLVPYIDPARLQQALKKELAPQILLATRPEEASLRREWRPRVMGPDKHRGYALQWFSLAAAVVVVTLLLTWRRLKQ
ncbi:MAG: SURF1 family protein [Xanthomonadales bacterium]|nr:SURF1 family protein [Xanthomonadales bacterium]